jgi:site-specific recombinase
MEKVDSRAKVGFILGLVSIIAWLLPIIGLPVTICAIIFSSLGLKSAVRRGKAITGLVLGIVFLILTLLNAIAGVVIGAVNAKYRSTAPVLQTSSTTSDTIQPK